jgi:hypothetical protein
VCVCVRASERLCVCVCERERESESRGGYVSVAVGSTTPKLYDNSGNFLTDARFYISVTTEKLMECASLFLLSIYGARIPYTEFRI